MIYTDREARLFRGVVVVIAFSTLAVAGLTYVQGTGNTTEILTAIVLAVILYAVGEWLLPVPLGPPRTPRPRPAPSRMSAWQRDPPATGAPSGIRSDRPR